VADDFFWTVSKSDQKKIRSGFHPWAHCCICLPNTVEESYKHGCNRTHVAAAHRSRMRTRSRHHVFPSDNPRIPSLYNGHRTERGASARGHPELPSEWDILRGSRRRHARSIICTCRVKEGLFHVSFQVEECKGSTWHELVVASGRRPSSFPSSFIQFAWLMYGQVAFYGLGLNSSAFGQYELPYGNDGRSQIDTVIDHLRKVCQGNLILATGLVPGYWVSFLFIDRIGRKPIQFMGFAVLTVIFCIMVCPCGLFLYFSALTLREKGFGFDKLTGGQTNGTVNHPAHPGFIFMFCLANFFLNFGPNVTTFVIPGELFPTRYRTSSFGISAACGKFGAIIAQVMFAKLSERMESKHAGLDTLARILSVFTILCANQS
jgi:hypothetical protein